MKPITLDPTTMSEAGALAIAALLEQLAAESEHLSGAVPAEFEAPLLDSAQTRREQAAEIRGIVAAKRAETQKKQNEIRARIAARAAARK
jgi:hypothetical protein